MYSRFTPAIPSPAILNKAGHGMPGPAAMTSAAPENRRWHRRLYIFSAGANGCENYSEMKVNSRGFARRPTSAGRDFSGPGKNGPRKIPEFCTKNRFFGDRAKLPLTAQNSVPYFR
jgi:hypothetical protein